MATVEIFGYIININHVFSKFVFNVTREKFDVTTSNINTFDTLKILVFRFEPMIKHNISHVFSLHLTLDHKTVVSPNTV